MKSLEIFSGLGGLALGSKYEGFQHLAFVEYDKHACNSLRSNYGDIKVYEQDVRGFNFEEYSKVDLIAGGPPCQPFSLGGKHKGNLDERDMFPHAVRAVREIEPKAFIFENVKGLLRESFATYFNYIILQLTYPAVTKKNNQTWEEHLIELEKIHTKGKYCGLKYNVVFRLINAANYGVPQKRERVFIVGIKDSLNIEWNFPEETHSLDRLNWDKYVTGDYWKRNKVKNSERDDTDQKNVIIKKRLVDKYGMFEPEHKPWVTIRESLADLPEPTVNDNTDHKLRPGAKIYPGHTGSIFDEPSKTIKAGGHGVPGGENMIRFINGDVRYLTVREAKRIQTFPDSYNIEGSWTEAMRQIGNAVPVNLARIISRSVKSALES